jgi:hypothetical protein
VKVLVVENRLKSCCCGRRCACGKALVADWEMVKSDWIADETVFLRVVLASCMVVI